MLQGETTYGDLRTRRTGPRTFFRPALLDRRDRGGDRPRAREAGCSIWWGSVLRGDNEWIEVGERSNIQESCTLHTDMGFPLTIGSDCTIGHNVVLHGCSIAQGSLIGMGAIVLNGAKIGPNSLIGAGALVTEGKEVTPN